MIEITELIKRIIRKILYGLISVEGMCLRNMIPQITNGNVSNFVKLNPEAISESFWTVYIIYRSPNIFEAIKDTNPNIIPKVVIKIIDALIG